MTTFDDRVAEFEHWLEPLDDGDEISEIANYLDRYADGFWTDLVTMFEAAHSDDASPLKPGHGADQLMLIRQYDGDGDVSCCTVTFHVGGLKLTTRAFERRELCTQYENGVEAAAEALATLAAAIDETLEPFAGLDMKVQGNDEAQRLLDEMRESIRQYREIRDEPERRQGHAVDAMFAAEKLDRLRSNGASLPASWINREAEGVRLAILSNARDEAKRAHRFHDEAAAEVDRLTAERRELWRTNSELQQEVLRLRGELDKTREGWTVIGVNHNDVAVPVGAVPGRVGEIQGGDRWRGGAWLHYVASAETAEDAEHLAVNGEANNDD